jgi:hypothetical protein
MATNVWLLPKNAHNVDSILKNLPRPLLLTILLFDLKTVLEADLGGTEIYDPLAWIFEQPTINGYSRQVFVLTDGEVCVFEIMITFKTNVLTQ